jgi:hypothetical protein
MTDLDRRLLLAGRLTMARSAADVSVRKKDSRAPRGAPRDPQIFVDEILTLARRGSRGARHRRF